MINQLGRVAYGLSGVVSRNITSLGLRGDLLLLKRHFSSSGPKFVEFRREGIFDFETDRLIAANPFSDILKEDAIIFLDDRKAELLYLNRIEVRRILSKSKRFESEALAAIAENIEKGICPLESRVLNDVRAGML